jgi:hypothetical protein
LKCLKRERCGVALDFDLVKDPTLIMLSQYATKAAVWFQNDLQP